MGTMTPKDLGLWLEENMRTIHPHISLQARSQVEVFVKVGEYDLAFDTILFSMQDSRGIPENFIPKFIQIINERELLKRAEHPEIEARYNLVIEGFRGGIPGKSN